MIIIFKERSPEPEDTCSQNARAIECPARRQDEDPRQDISAQTFSTGPWRTRAVYLCFPLF